jgi:hypothetical protein
LDAARRLGREYLPWEPPPLRSVTQVIQSESIHDRLALLPSQA